MQRHSLMAAVLSALAAFSATPAVRQVRAAQRHPTSQRSPSVGLTRYSTGPGWGHAQVKRMAKKRKNQQRNKLAHRRAGA